MSGGSWDYCFGIFEDTAQKLKNEKCSLRRALGKKVQLIAKALHDIEWADSGDTSPGSEIGPIKDAIGKDWKEHEIIELMNDAKIVFDRLELLLNPPNGDDHTHLNSSDKTGKTGKPL